MLHRKILTLIGILVFIGLMASPLPVRAAKLSAGEFPIANDSLQEVTPSVAYNSQRNYYLVVWSNDRPGNDDLRAQKVSADGSLMGGPFYIVGGSGHDRWKPDITYDSMNDQFLVVWEDYENVGTFKGNSIRARRVSGTGMVLDTNDRIIRAKSTTFYTPSEPAVAFSTASNRYLVVWHEVSHVLPITQNINCQVIRPDGSLEGGVRPIPGSTKNHSAPGLAYNRKVNRYMVAWQEYNSTQSWYDVKGQQVQGNGNLWGSTNTYSYSNDAWQGPVVASLPDERSGKTFAIAWTAYVAGSWTGYGSVFTDNDGVKKDSSGASWISKYLINHIAIAANQRRGTYQMAFQFDKGIMDKLIDIREAKKQFPFKDLHWEEAFTIPGTANDFPALAVGPAGECLVVWQGQPISATSKNIYGRILPYKTSSYLPLIKK